jgi:hypothetical protein
MRRIASFEGLERFGRERLGRHFTMRDFLYSEIGNWHGIRNLPDDPELALAAGRKLATELLDPLVETFGGISVRSAYRSREVNRFGNEHGLNCSRNEASHAKHIWDRRDNEGRMGACACVVVPWFADQYEARRGWTDLAWWIHDHLPYSEMVFFPKRAALNLTWREVPVRRIASWIGGNKVLLAAGAEPGTSLDERRAAYADFPPFRGIRFPELPARWRDAG